MRHILVVEDERDLNDLVAAQLRKEGYRVSQAFDGRAAVDQARECQPDLVLLDWMLPGLDGVSALREIRRFSLVPILMLTARGQDIDIVNGLEAGADDYLPKPAHMRVLRARIAALLRRAATSNGASPRDEPESLKPAVDMGPIHLDREAREATVRGRPVDLTRTEYDLLELFCLNPGRAFSREYLLERIWADSPDVGVRTVDTHVQRLRKKLGDGDATIQTVWGMGYRVKAG
jgi:DNA-binding response OmpR family regulator